MRLAGLIALSDPPRADSAAMITEMRTLGVRTVMVTGDAPATAAIVAHAVGLEGAVCPPGPIGDAVTPEQFAVFAGVLPEDKYNLVKAFQKGGHNVAMCGDGANDAPALRQAQMGIAVSTATDVAKSAAGIVLTEPGLGGIVASLKEGRMTFQRILTYALSSVTKKTVQVLFLAVGLVMTGHAILTPMLMVIMMLTGDFLGMSLTTDNVSPSPLPNTWRIGSLTIAGVFMGLCELVFCTARFDRRQIPARAWNRGAANFGLSRHRVRQSGYALRPPRTPTAVVVVRAKPLARSVVRSGCPDCFDTGRLRNRNDGFASHPCGRHAGRGSCFGIRRGCGEIPGIQSPQDRLEACSARGSARVFP